MAHLSSWGLSGTRCAARLLSLMCGCAVLSCSVGDCGGAENPGRVPFKVQRRSSRESSSPEQPTEQRPVVELFSPGVRSLDVDGAHLAVGSHTDRDLLRVAVKMDFDGDGDADVLALTTHETRLEVIYAKRAASAFEPPRVLADLEWGPCVPEHNEAHLIAKGLIELVTRGACGAFDARAEVHWVFAAKETPTLVERFSLIPGLGETETRAELALRAADVDGDGNLDVIVGIRHTNDEEGARKRDPEIELPWLDRPGGLARPPDEPEAALDEIADALSFSGESAEKAQELLALHALICRESGVSRLQVGPNRGLTCGASAAATKAAAIHAATLTARLCSGANLSPQGCSLQETQAMRLREALERLDNPAFRGSAAVRREFERAWTKTVLPITEAWQKLTDLPPPVYLQTPGLWFSRPDSLVVRSAPPRRIAVPSGDVRGVVQLGGAPWEDPTGRFFISHIERDCEGYQVVVKAKDGTTERHLLLEGAPPPADAPCPHTWTTSVPWVPLGWAPQGIVAIRADREPRVVPSGPDGDEAGPPVALSPGQPLPAPMRSTLATSDGTIYAWPTHRGIFLRERSKTAAVRFLPFDPAWPEPPDSQAVALSPHAERLAALTGSSVYMIDLGNTH